MFDVKCACMCGLALFLTPLNLNLIYVHVRMYLDKYYVYSSVTVEPPIERTLRI